MPGATVLCGVLLLAILVCTSGAAAETPYFPGQQGDIRKRYGVEDLLRQDIEEAQAVPGPMVERCGAAESLEVALTNATYEAAQEDPRIDGDLAVWREEDRDLRHHPGFTEIDKVWVMDLRTGKKSQLPFPPSDVNDAPDVSGFLVAYIRQQIPTDRNPAQVYLYNLQTGEERQISNGLAKKSDVAIAGYHVVWIEHGDSGPGSVHHYDLVRGTDEVISSVNPSYNTVSVSDDWAVWDEPVRDVHGNTKYSIRLYGFSTRSKFDLTGSMPGNQRYPVTDGEYIAWANVSPKYGDGIADSIVIYHITDAAIQKTIGLQYDPGPPAISGNRVVWHGNSYDIGLDDTKEQAAIQPVKVADELYPVYGYQTGYADISGNRVVYSRLNPLAWKGDEHQMEIYLYNLTQPTATPCHPQARIEATPGDGQVPLTVRFEGIGSSSPHGGIRSYQWAIYGVAKSLDTPLTQSQANFTISFVEPGVYLARLRVEDHAGEFNSSEKYIVALSPDDARITRDPNWDALVVDMRNGYLCWNEVYKPRLASNDESRTNPDLAYSTTRTVLYSLSTGVRTMFKGTFCALGDGVMAYHMVPQRPEDPDRFRILSLPSLATSRDLTVGHGRLWGISGKTVFWEGQNPLSLYYHWPLTLDSPWTKCAAMNCAMTSDIMSYDAGYSIAGVTIPAVNLTNDPHDNNFPRMNGETIVWVDYADLRTWPTVDPVLRVYNLTSRQKFSIPTKAIQISADVSGDRVVWIQDRNEAGKRDVTVLPWTTTLHEFNLTTGTQRLLKTFPTDVSPRKMSVFGDRVLWVIDDDLWMFDLRTQTEKRVTFDGRFRGVLNIDQECEFAAYSSDRGGQYDIYLMKLPSTSGTLPGECGTQVSYSLPPPTLAPPRPGPGEETPAQGGGFLGWLLGIFRVFRPETSPATLTPLDIRVAEHLCNDGNACTVNDRWIFDICTGGAGRTCDDNNPETTDTCDPKKGCLFTPVTAGRRDESPCDDGNACTFGEYYRGRICTGGAPVVCDDNNPATTDTCDPKKGCISTPLFTGPDDYSPCDDGNACTFGEYYQNGICTGGAPVVCNDGDPRTVDSCEPGRGCIHTTTGGGGPCAEPCTCMFEYEARERFGSYVRCSDTPCSADYSRISAVAYKYCYRSAQGGGTVVLVQT